MASLCIGKNRAARVGFGAWLLVGGASACSDKKPEYPGPYGRQVAQIVPKIERAVGLKFKTPPRVEARSKDQVRDFVMRQFRDLHALA